MKLSVVIVSYNVKAYLEQCLYALRKACCHVDAEIWVVDNASEDGSVKYICNLFPEVRMIANQENVGFSCANNMAIREATGEYVLLLNPDTIIGEHVLRECVDFLDAHPEAGATGVAMQKDDGTFAWESRRGLPTPWTSFCKMSGLCSLFPRSRRFGRYYMRYLDKERPNRIEVISGAFNMIRRSALDRVGLLDEDFFMYGEDIDLSYRLLQGGYENYYLPCRILHYKGESTHKSSFRYVHVFYNAMLVFFDKHYRRRSRWLTPLIRMAVLFRGGLDLFLRQCETLLVLLRMKRDHELGKSYLFLGRTKSIEKACMLSVKHGLKMDFVQADEKTMPNGHLDTSFAGKTYDYVVYDAGAYPYTTMLNLMVRGVKRRKMRLATFSVETGKIITLSRVYE